MDHTRANRSTTSAEIAMIAPDFDMIPPDIAMIPPDIAMIPPDVAMIPPDIIFKFPEADDDDASVAAHKTILAEVSKVFKNNLLLHNSMDKSTGDMVMGVTTEPTFVVISDTTKPIFQIMVNAIYGVMPIQESLREKSLNDVFGVLYLVSKYEITELIVAVKECLSSFPITEDTVQRVAADAMNFLATFNEEAQKILLSCARILRNMLAQADYPWRFIAEKGELMVAVHRLLSICENCMEDPCRNGTPIHASQFREGLRVDHASLDNFAGLVLDIEEGDRVELKYNHNWELRGELYVSTVWSWNLRHDQFLWRTKFHFPVQLLKENSDYDYVDVKTWNEVMYNFRAYVQCLTQ